MPDHLNIDRRHMLAAGVGIAATATSAHAAPSPAADHVTFAPGGGDVSARLQRTIRSAAAARQPIRIAPGNYDIASPMRLLPGTKLVGPHGLATFRLTGRGAFIADNASDILLTGLTLAGAATAPVDANAAALILNACANLEISNVVIETAPRHGIKLWQCSGRIARCRFEGIGHTAINSGNATALDITHNHIRHAGNNGIVVWRDAAGPDGTTVTNNHISHIRTDAGGSGQNGNAINVFRAGHVIISTNTIADCAYSAVRCNAASNAQIIANNCRDIGEVALYAEFGFEGAVIANNLVDHAATGIEVTNFKEGGRLATVQGNIIRNLVRREHEPVDKRGIGISVEADTVVNANTIENAATAGIAIGWGQWLRHVAASGNLIRNAEIGIAVSSHGAPGTVLISNNIISAAPGGAVRLLDHDTPVGDPLGNQPLTDGQATNQSPAILHGNLIS